MLNLYPKYFILKHNKNLNKIYNEWINYNYYDLINIHKIIERKTNKSIFFEKLCEELFITSTIYKNYS